MIPKDKLDELRPLVAETPEGSVARKLLAMIDEVLDEQNAQRRSSVIDYVRRQGRTPEEAELIVSVYDAPGSKIEMETVLCWECEGTGYVPEPGGCMGVGAGTCQTCHGSQRASRLKMPPQGPQA